MDLAKIAMKILGLRPTTRLDLLGSGWACAAPSWRHKARDTSQFLYHRPQFHPSLPNHGLIGNQKYWNLESLNNAMEKMMKQRNDKINTMESTVSDQIIRLVFSQQEFDEVKSSSRNYEKKKQATRVVMNKLTEQVWFITVTDPSPRR